VVSSRDGCEEVLTNEDTAYPWLHQNRKSSFAIKRKDWFASG